MKNFAIIGCLAFIFVGSINGQDPGLNDSLQIKNQLSAWGHFNPDNSFPFLTGGRYIPQMNYNISLDKEKLIDFEASLNAFGTLGVKFFDSTNTDGDIKLYRLWTRYSTSQLEVRIGLQKINFGSANMLRPLMWFDQIDPRDPLQLTDGVYGALIRYYFMNNANLWLWALYGNKNTKGWETLKSNYDIPEFGGRVQYPVPSGEAAFSFHHRNTSSEDLPEIGYSFSKIPENRIGFDLRMDLIFGCWIEGSWVKKGKDIGMLTTQEIINAGVDYTFGIGNGLYMVYEQLLASSDQKPFEFSNTISFSLLSLSYPVGLFDNLNGILYYDWSNKNAYSFLNWQRKYDRITFYLMGYWNPKNYNIPTQGESSMLFAGKGLQAMMVWNY